MPPLTNKTNPVGRPIGRDLLPRGFQRVEYLESKGQQCINTEIIPSGTVKFETKVQFLYGYDDDYFASIRHNTATDSRFYLLNMHRSECLVVTTGFWFGNILSTGLIDKNSVYIYESTISDETLKLKLIKQDGTTVNYSKRNTTPMTPTIPLPLFGGNLGGNFRPSPRGTRCWYARLFQNDVLVADFVPCLDNNGRPCMVNLVTKKAYYDIIGQQEFSYKI